MENKKENKFTFLDLIMVLVNYRVMILVGTLIGSVLGVIIMLSTSLLPSNSPYNFIPDYFRSEAKILLNLPGDSKGSLSSLSSSSGMGSLLGLVGGGGMIENVGAFVEELIKLNEIADSIIDEFQLTVRYNIKKFPRTATRKIFYKKCIVKLNVEGTIVSVAYEDIDSKFATNVVNRIIEKVVDKYGQISRANLEKKKSFLEESLAVAEKDFNRIQEELINFQKKNGIINISTQAQQTITQIAKIKAELAAKELELKGLLEYYSENDPKVVRKKKEIEITRQTIAGFENGLEDDFGLFIPTNMIPELSRKYLNLELELNIQSAIYKMVREQYEATKIEELNTTDRFQVLEQAEIPEKKYGPPRGLTCIAITLVSFVILIFITFISEYFKNAKKNPVEEEKIAHIKAQIKNIVPFRKKKS